MSCHPVRKGRAIAVMVVALSIVGSLVALVPSGASAETVGVPAQGSVQPRTMYVDVVDTYLLYFCANGYSSHHINRYNETYRSLAVPNGYAPSGSEKIDTWTARVCSCETPGRVEKYKVYYHVW